jgi:hypothetical protein
VTSPSLAPGFNVAIRFYPCESPLIYNYGISQAGGGAARNFKILKTTYFDTNTTVTTSIGPGERGWGGGVVGGGFDTNTTVTTSIWPGERGWGGGWVVVASTPIRP